MRAWLVQGLLFVFMTGAVIAGSAAVLARRLALQHGAHALVAPQLTSACVIPLVTAIALGRDMVPADGFSVLDVSALVAIGVRPNVALAEAAGIELGGSQCITTDEFINTLLARVPLP